jgi:alcohol dehydrogenase (cytochrome c)
MFANLSGVGGHCRPRGERHWRACATMAFLSLGLPICGSAQTDGRMQFEARCAGCHGSDGKGGERGPAIVGRPSPRTQTRQALRGVIRNGIPAAGMPAFPLTDKELDQIVGFLWPLMAKPAVSPRYEVVSVRLRDGRTVRGLVKNESNYDLQLQGLDGKLYLLLHDEIVSLTREGRSLMPPANTRQEAPAVSRLGDWPTYHGDVSGNRHSALRQINTSNVAELAPRWIFSIPGSRRLEVTPVVIDGVMYVTTANEAYALDARTGREIWHYQRPRTKGLVGDAAGGINRGVAVLGDKIFMVTDNAHLLCLHRITGALLWDVEMADYRQHYGATAAPLVVKNLVVSGVSGGDEGVRGFVAAYGAATGKLVWRFWTIPLPGEPLAETWVGRDLEHGCASTWLTGTYDPEADLLYWPTGNPCPDYNGDERKGDNLYSDSVLALKPDTGELRWHYQYTPHDLHDWDAQQTPMLVDAEFRGKPRHLLVQANRNGFFYVLDRITGELLMAKPFVEKLTWASGVGSDGRPQLMPGAEPTPQGVRVCPSVEGATNWMSTAYNPATGLFYVMALEKCNIYTKSPAHWEPGKSFYGGSTRDVPGEAGKKYLRALDLQTGKVVWEYPQIGPANTWGGVLSTAGGLVFFGDDSGAFAAADARTGKPLWHFHTSQTWKASPLTYMAGGKQYVAVAAGSNILAFGLP